MNLKTMKLTDFLTTPIHCSCGRTHSFEMKTIEISAGALQSVPIIMSESEHKKAFIISDRNTYGAAGKSLLTIFEETHTPYTSFVLNEAELIPDEKTLGSILMHFDQECDVIIAVGSGTLNDICRFVSHRLGLPYFIVATAPSMDGYASTVAPLIMNNLKTTFECHKPEAIIADLDIIAQAPTEMIAAGFGDILGKFTCLVDWKLSAIINGEYYCETIAEIMRFSLEKTIALREGVATRDKAAIGELMEALILAGIAMSYAGNSRPASGSEHHISHFWEMRFLLEGKKAILHGSKVGMATILVLKLHQYLHEENLDIAAIANITPPVIDDNWFQEITRVFRAASAEVVLLEKRTQKNSPDGHTRRIAAIAKHWEDIQDVLETLPSPQTVTDLLASVQGPVHPSQVGIDQELMHDSVLYAKEIRPRYTTLQLLWDLDLLTTYAERIVNEVYGEC